MKLDYRIAIASRGRAGSITTVENCGLDPARVDVFVDGVNEQKLYQRHHPNLNVINTTTSGIAAARNVMLDYYGTGASVVMMCDDVRNVLEFTGAKRLTPLKGEELDTFIHNAFAAALQHGTKLWGVYPVNNHFYMKHTLSSGFCIGSFCGVVVSDIDYPEDMPLKEDYAFTIDHVKAFRKVVRFNYITVDAVHYRNAGGCQLYRDDAREEEACQYLLTHYPWCVGRHPRRQHEIILRFKKASV
jgi:TET-associated glycosyltransferase-like protein